MKVLLINKFLYPKGGDAISTLNTGRLLASEGHDVIYWGMHHPLNPKYPYSEYFVSYTDFYQRGSVKNQVKTTSNILYSFEAKKNIKKLIQTIKPDIVHLNNFAHQISPSILHIFKQYRIPVVMTMHDYKMVCPIYTLLLNGKPCERCKFGRYYQCFINKCTKNSYAKSLINAVEMYLHHNILHIYNIVDVFISPSQFLENKVKEMGFSASIAYLPNFVNTNDFEPSYGWKEKEIIYYGRLSKEKGLKTLINAVKEIDGVKLKIIGEGPLREELQKEIFDKKISNVEFLGYKTGDDLKNEISNSMFVVIPSEWYEVFGLTVIESFALGKPVIGARIGGVPELIKDNETGLIFEPGNLLDLRSKITYLIDKPSDIIRMGKNARKFVETELNSKKHYEALMKIYKRALALHGGQ